MTSKARDLGDFISIIANGTSGQVLTIDDAAVGGVSLVSSAPDSNNQSHRGWRIRRITGPTSYVVWGALEFNDVPGATTGGIPVYSTQYSTSG